MSDQQSYTPTGMPTQQPGYSASQPAPFQAPKAFHAPNVAPLHAAPMPLPQPILPSFQQSQAQVSPAVSVMAMPQHLEQSSVAVSVPVVGADDDDNQLDEVWINKAKEVVTKTQHDPYLESSELSKIKAAYLKSRYNKDIKIIEDRPQ